MVQFMGFHIEDQLEDEHAPLNKRCKQWSASKDASLSCSSRENSILDEPSPLGLSLKKSLSFLDLIQTRLAQGNTVTATVKTENSKSGLKNESQGGVVPGSVEKHKASNFTAKFLRIGSWEYKSKYEGDLVAKCYFAKRKLVWEVLDGELKSKIEIQWADITALKANCPDEGPSSLTLVVAKRPLFFRETNPQPRKHTLWQSTVDFTGEQATKHRQHFLQFEQGMLIKHFEKLIQCDIRLKFLSQQPDIKLESPYFDTPAAFENPSDLKNYDLHQVGAKGLATSHLQNMGSPHSSLSPSFTIENNDPSSITLDSVPCEAPSSSSEGVYCSEVDSKDPRNWEQIKRAEIRRSMSVSDFIGHIEHHISEEIASGNPSFSAEKLEYQNMLDDIAHHLLNDNHVTTTSDETSLMRRVDSLCCLLQKDPVAVLDSDETAIMKRVNSLRCLSEETSLMKRVNSLRCLLQMDLAAVPDSHDNTSSVEEPNDGKNVQLSHDLESMQGNRIKIEIKAAEKESGDVYGGMHAPGMSRRDSFGDLLLSLPRIASLPKLLFNISEEDTNIETR